MQMPFPVGALVRDDFGKLGVVVRADKVFRLRGYTLVAFGTDRPLLVRTSGLRWASDALAMLRRRAWYLFAGNVGFGVVMGSLSMLFASRGLAWLAAGQAWGAGWFLSFAFWQFGWLRGDRQ